MYIQGPLLSDYTANEVIDIEDQKTVPEALKADVPMSVFLRWNRPLNALLNKIRLFELYFVYCTDMSRFYCKRGDYAAILYPMTLLLLEKHMTYSLGVAELTRLVDAPFLAPLEAITID